MFQPGFAVFPDVLELWSWLDNRDDIRAVLEWSGQRLIVFQDGSTIVAKIR